MGPLEFGRLEEDLAGLETARAEHDNACNDEAEPEIEFTYLCPICPRSCRAMTEQEEPPIPCLYPMRGAPCPAWELESRSYL